jgi:hypothetical protein
MYGWSDEATQGSGTETGLVQGRWRSIDAAARNSERVQGVFGGWDGSW